MVRFLDLMRPARQILFQVKSPEKKPEYNEKVIYTAVVLMLFLLLGQIPLYGIDRQAKSDPLYFARLVLASSKGTLMELGISPIVTSSMVLNLMETARVIHVDKNVHEDRQLSKIASKFFALLLTFGQAFVYVYSGAYGPISQLGFVTAILIVFQLTMAGVLLVLLDEMLSKGWGLSQGGISLFIAVNIAETIVWKSFSPMTINTGRGAEFEGAVVALFHFLITRVDKLKAIREAFFRVNQPNLFQLFSTFAIFIIVIYLQAFKIELDIKPINRRGETRKYPIKLFYTSNIPVILQAALIQNINLISETLHRRFEGNVLVRLLGRWAVDERTRQFRPVGGLAYYLHAPDSVSDFARDPIHGVFYILFVVAVCALFARTYVEISGSGPREVAKMFKDGGWSIVQAGKNESNVRFLSRVIPTAAALGGGIIGGLTVIADIVGAFGSGTGLLLAIGIVTGIFEEHRKSTEGDHFD